MDQNPLRSSMRMGALPRRPTFDDHQENCPTKLVWFDGLACSTTALSPHMAAEVYC